MAYASDGHVPQRSEVMSDPLVTIIIDNYNYGRFLRDAIDSALDQEYLQVEIIVVDDGSTDSSRDVIADYGDRIISVLKANGGQFSAFNAGFAASQGSIICLLDSDDVFLPGKVGRIVREFERYPDIGSCFHTRKLINSIGSEASIPQLARPGWHDFRPDIKRGKMPFVPTATSGLCFRRSLLQLLCPLPERPRPVTEYYMKCVALVLQPTCFMDEPLAVQRLHGDNSYTLKADDQKKVRDLVISSWWMRQRFPEDLARWSDRVFADGLARYWRSGSVDQELRDYIRGYLSTLPQPTRLRIMLRVLGERLGMEGYLRRWARLRRSSE